MTTRLEDIHCLTISGLAGLLRTRALSTVEVRERSRSVLMRSTTTSLRAFCHLTADPALDTAGRPSGRSRRVATEVPCTASC
jgi:hypothetical protein